MNKFNFIILLFNYYFVNILAGQYNTGQIETEKNQNISFLENNVIEKNGEDEINRTLNDTPTKFPPKFKHPSKMFNMEVKAAGSSIRLKCPSEGNPKPNITWYKNGGRVVRSFSQPNFVRWSMILDDLTGRDNGNYTCVVCNDSGCIEHTVTLHVQERYLSRPRIKEGYPKNTTAVVMSSATFSCPIDSDFKPYVYWVYCGNNTGTEASNCVGDPIETYNELDPQQLTISNVTQQDEGWYGCVAQNALGETTAISYLTVLDGDQIRRQMLEKQVRDLLEDVPDDSLDSFYEQMHTLVKSFKSASFK